MEVIREISEAEMIGEFLYAELYSSRFRKGSLRALEILGYDEKLLIKPDYSDTLQNEKRAKVLGLCRGWPDKYLFTNFPKDIKWFEATMTQDELRKSYRLKSLSTMTDHARVLSNTAERFNTGRVIRSVDPKVINQIKTKIEEGVILPPIILVSTSLEGKKVLIEGHSRSIAYSLVDKSFLTQEISTILGISNGVANWAYY